MAKTATQIAAEKAAAKAAAIANALGASASGTGTAQYTLPSYEQLIANKVPETVAKKYGGTKQTVPTVSSTGKNLSSGQSMEAFLGKLPTTVQNAVQKLTGLDNPSLGKTFNERVNALVPQLTDQNGNLGLLDPTAAIQFVNLGKTNAQLASALASGDRAILLGASESAKYGAVSGADATLTNWGLDTPEMTALVSKFASAGMINQNEIMDQIRQTATYKQAFPGLAELNANPNQVHLTEGQYQTHSEQYLGMAQQAGIRLTQADIGKLVQGNVSPTEYQQRINDIYSVVQNANPNTKAILQKEYGVNTNDLVHYMATGALPDQQRQVASAQIQDYASRVGLTGLDQTGAEQLANMAKLSSTTGNQSLGVGVSNIQNSLLNASRDVNLTGFTPGSGVQNIDTKTLIGSQIAGFGGTTQVETQAAVQKAEQSAAAPFQKGGGYAESAKGVIGLGAARV